MGNNVSFVKPDDQVVVQGNLSNKCTAGTVTDNYKIMIDISELYGQGKNSIDNAKYIDQNSVYRTTLGPGIQAAPNGIINASKQSAGTDHNWYAFDLDMSMNFDSVTKILTSPPTSMSDVIKEPWSYCRPNATATAGYPRMFRMEDNSLSVNNRLGKIVANGLASQTYLNETNSRPREITTDNFKPGEFNVYKNYLYVYRIYNKDTSVYTTYYFIILETNEKFWMRCCANNVSQNVIGYCPSQYINNDNKSCDLLTTCVCTDPNNPSNAEAACGCYDQYVKKYIDADPKFKNYLSTTGTQFPASCAKTCSIGRAYVPQNLKPCNLTICSTDMGSSSNLAGDKLSVLQNCGSGTGIGTNTSNPINQNNDQENVIIDFIKHNIIYELLIIIVIMLIVVLLYCCFKKKTN